MYKNICLYLLLTAIFVQTGFKTKTQLQVSVKNSTDEIGGVVYVLEK